MIISDRNVVIIYSFLYLPGVGSSLEPKTKYTALIP